jgi:hypothetical protein
MLLPSLGILFIREPIKLTGSSLSIPSSYTLERFFPSLHSKSVAGVIHRRQEKKAMPERFLNRGRKLGRPMRIVNRVSVNRDDALLDVSQAIQMATRCLIV